MPRSSLATHGEVALLAFHALFWDVNDIFSRWSDYAISRYKATSARASSRRNRK